MISSLSDRSHYSSLEQCIYLNQASLGLIGQPAVTAMHKFLDDVGRHGNMNMCDSDEVSFFSELRHQASKLLNCPPSQLAIIASAGEMLSQLPVLFNPPPGSKIVSISTEFPAITRPWVAYAANNDCTVEFVDETMTESLTESLIKSIDQQTSVVVISLVQFSSGTLIDIPLVREATRQVGAKLMVDITQAAGALVVDTKNLDAEVIVCSGYKWLGGHGGVGLAVMSPEFLNQTPPSPGWMGAADPFDFKATKLPLANDARRYTQSTMSYISIRGLTVAISEILTLNPINIEAHARSLATLLFEELEGTDWTPYGADGTVLQAPNIITLTHNDFGRVGKAEQSLRKNKIIVGSRNNRIRVSLAHYNNENDVSTLVQVLQQDI